MTLAAYSAVAMKKAERILAKMPDAPENDDAKAALAVGVAVMKNPTLSAKDQLAGARMVLEWTQAKPASKSEVVVNEAEAWLASLDDQEEPANDDDDIGEDEPSEGDQAQTA